MRRVRRQVAHGTGRLCVAVNDAADLQAHVRRVAEASLASAGVVESGAELCELGALRIHGDLAKRTDHLLNDCPHPLANRLPARLDDVLDPFNALVQGSDLDEVIEDWLCPRKTREAADRRGERVWPRAPSRCLGIARVGLEVKQPPIDLSPAGRSRIASIAGPKGLLSSTPPSTNHVSSG